MPLASQLVLPAVGPDAIYCTLYSRDPAFTALAEAELHALGGGMASERGVWLSHRPIHWARCGYGIAGGRQLAFAPTLALLREALVAMRIAASSFNIDVLRLPRWRKGATAAKTLIANCIHGGVSVDNPQLRLLLVMSPHGFRLLVNATAAPGEQDWQGIAHKPHNYMVALPVRIGQAMLNITARSGDSVLDPFCGTGTIPLLAAQAGLQATGSDISAACIERARANLLHFGGDASLRCADARDLRAQADCIVTNLPYGVYSHFARDSLQAVLLNLGRLAARVTIVSSDHIEDSLLACGFRILHIIAVESERFERFVYVLLAPDSAHGDSG